MEFTASFAHFAERWHDFFVLSGTAAATLMGLLFVALSLHLDVLVHKDGAHFSSLALQAFLNFVFVLLISLFLLIPILTGRMAGMTLMMLGLLRIVLFARSARSFSRQAVEVKSPGLLIIRYFLPVAAYLALFASGLALTRRDFDGGMMGLFPAIGLMLVGATRSAWDLIILVGKHKMERAKTL